MSEFYDQLSALIGEVDELRLSKADFVGHRNFKIAARWKIGSKLFSRDVIIPDQVFSMELQWTLWLERIRREVGETHRAHGYPAHEDRVKEIQGASDESKPS